MSITRLAAGALAFGVAAATILAGCGRVDEPTGTSSQGGNLPALTIGSTDKSVSLDPAGAYDHGSLTLAIEVFSFLYTFVPGQDTPQPDAAQSCGFTSDPTIFECKLRSGIKFANGHDLTSSDVKFSFDRIIKIADPNGPASLLVNLASVTAKDDLTVDFTLKEANDQTFAQVLATCAGPIVDEEVFPADKLLPDEDIVKANAFSGPYVITSYSRNDVVQFAPYAGYIGASPKVANGGVTLKTYTDATNLKMAVTNGDIDIAYRSLTPTDIESFQSNPDIKVWSEKGGEIRFLVFNLNTMPGDTDEQKLAIRQAIASSVDRQQLATNVYKDQYTPLCSYVPDGFVGATKSVCDAYGSAPDKAKAAKYLSDAGVTTPVTINLQYNPDHYGSSSDQEYGLIKQQLESTGLFTVNLQSTEWVTYNQERVNDAYPVYQLGWFPDFPDADNYLTPFFMTGNFVNNHFQSDEMDQLIMGEVTQPDAATRTQMIGNIQDILAQKYLPTLPLLQGSQWAFSTTNVSGITLGVDDNLRWATITKS